MAACSACPITAQLLEEMVAEVAAEHTCTRIGCVDCTLRAGNAASASDASADVASASDTSLPAPSPLSAVVVLPPWDADAEAALMDMAVRDVTPVRTPATPARLRPLAQPTTPGIAARAALFTPTPARTPARSAAAAELGGESAAKRVRAALFNTTPTRPGGPREPEMMSTPAPAAGAGAYPTGGLGGADAADLDPSPPLAVDARRPKYAQAAAAADPTGRRQLYAADAALPGAR